MRGTPPVCPKGGKGSVQGAEQGVKQEGSNEHLPVVNEPFVADALGFEGVGEELPKMSVTRSSTSALWMVPSTSPEQSRLRPPGSACAGPGEWMAIQRRQKC